jgi:hypothetical protein
MEALESGGGVQQGDLIETWALRMCLLSAMLDHGSWKALNIFTTYLRLSMFHKISGIINE